MESGGAGSEEGETRSFTLFMKRARNANVA